MRPHNWSPDANARPERVPSMSVAFYSPLRAETYLRHARELDQTNSERARNRPAQSALSCNLLAYGSLCIYRQGSHWTARQVRRPRSRWPRCQRHRCSRGESPDTLSEILGGEKMRRTAASRPGLPCPCWPPGRRACGQAQQGHLVRAPPGTIAQVTSRTSSPSTRPL